MIVSGDVFDILSHGYFLIYLPTCFFVVFVFRVVDEIEALKAILLDDELNIKENER